MPVYFQLLLSLINQPRRDGTVSWRWYTAAAAGQIQTRDFVIASAALYKTANSVTYYQHLSSVLISQ